jgi:uncharacterized membrane-anchored protein YjiN (DUF445 family)
MRLLATLVLAGMAVLFVAAGLARRRWPWLAYPQAFAEAGMVGACADWFAVSALFRRPFGLPIPHTGVLPRNQARIGATIANFVVANFLTAEVLGPRLEDIDASGAMARWLRQPQNARRVARQAAPFLSRIMVALPREKVQGMVGALARQGVEATPAAPLAAHLLAALWDQGHGQVLLDKAIEQSHAYLVRRKRDLRPAPPSGKTKPGWVDRMLADRAIDSLAGVVADMKRPDHPLRADVRAAVRKLIVQLATDPEIIARGEAIKAELLESPALVKRAQAAWSELETDLLNGDAVQAQALGEGLEYALRGLADWLAESPRQRAWLNRWVRRAVQDSVLPRRAEIGAIIAAVVTRWDAQTMVAKIELEVGRDLQYIRINGALVGGLVGLLIFALARRFGLS